MIDCFGFVQTNTAYLLQLERKQGFVVDLNFHHPFSTYSLLMATAPAKSTLFLGDLSAFCNEEDIHKLFSPFGEIVEIKIMRSEETSRNLSYGFIKFASAACAKKAMNAIDGTLFCGRHIRYDDKPRKNFLLILTFSFVTVSAGHRFAAKRIPSPLSITIASNLRRFTSPTSRTNCEPSSPKSLCEFCSALSVWSSTVLSRSLTLTRYISLAEFTLISFVF